MTVRATGSGAPTRSFTHSRSFGPSFSRKKIENRQNDRKNASDAIPWMPETMPWMNVERDDEIAAAVPSAAFDAPDESTPRLVSHDVPLSSAELACFEISPACAEIPPITRTAISTPRAISPSRTRTAPHPRFQPRRSSCPTSGDATQATTNPAVTGPTIPDIFPSVHSSTASRPTAPSRSHDVRPRSRIAGRARK